MPNPLSGRGRVKIAMAGAALGVVAILMITPLVPVWGIAYHEVCSSGTVVTKIALLTPLALLTSPFRGSG